MSVVWFKRDLRVEDHPALARAAAGDAPVLPLYIVEPGLWAGADASHRQWAFVVRALERLRDDLGQLGAPLVVRVGEAVEVLREIDHAHGIERLFSHEETGTLWTYRRDLAVAAWARGAGVVWEELPQSGVVRRLKSRDGWSKARDGFVFAEPTPLPRALRPLPGVAAGAIPAAGDLGLAPDGLRNLDEVCPLDGGARLGAFLGEDGQTYRRAMSSPVTAEAACSRLSPHFAWGTMSVRQAAQATAARQREVRGTRDGWIGSLKSFQARLAWRDHFIQKLEDAPDLEARCMHPAYEDLRGDDPALRGAWERGETGVPFVDACMRYLIATGWINFRMRAMLVSFASYHLWLDWRATGPHLARMFIDYEPGIHWPQVQMQSGTTGINTPRIYNPVKQGREQDPDGVFTRRWLPELAEVPDRYLQEPWLWDGARGLAYPAPVVDVTRAARAARERIWAVRKGEDFRDEAGRIVQKHASRKDGTGRFVRDRTRPADDRQLRMDF